MKSDVIALQEILDLNALKNLAGGLGFQHIAATPDRRGNRVAFLTRNDLAQDSQQIVQWQLPKKEKVRYFDKAGNIREATRFPRPALQITVKYGDSEIDIITAHLKSKLLTFSGGKFSTKDETVRAQTAYFALQRRSAETTSLREHVTCLLKKCRRVVVLGDLNDGSEAATTQILYGAPGSQPGGPADATRKGAFQKADVHDPQRLFNVTKLISQKSRWSRLHGGHKELLDHILASSSMMPRKLSGAGLRKVPTMTIHHTVHVAGGVVPDHAPVTATFV